MKDKIRKINIIKEYKNDSFNKKIYKIVGQSFLLLSENSKKSSSLINRVKILNKKIQSILDSKRLSIEHITYIEIALQNIKTLENQKVNDKSDENKIVKFQNIFNNNKHDVKNSSIALQILEMCYCFYKKKYDMGMNKYNQLSDNHKNCLKNRIARAKITFIDHNSNDSDILAFIKVLVEYAIKLAHGKTNGYHMDIPHIINMFEEAKEFEEY